ncbi:biopolymer transporter ExbD [Polynucleobacter paneuropaeus]|jgi:biopolymer transport protein ExbD|nr:biopolymer transporter ExbD [Polynucleobacter paneuropaeus]MBT8530872.1 biopolymer transporter ExbD [Polynucleobacter paneuropaeus]MBT8563276.1 biopolymer transporter ExbD [Polynucleobacter paneuropaeus]MBT8567927.1 biopolymer transporter ExbD [Polynucleobacter paneuropaeus]MBT8568364.1 biopolymer transporter ExbD [Polynucleobacter paneuropaeus]
MSWLSNLAIKTASKKGGFSLGLSARTQSPEPEINLIPFIDVLLVVLIFLMISTTFTHYQELAISLPTANGSDNASQTKQIHVAVSSDGRFAINGRVTERSQLAAILNQDSPNKDMQVSIDADARAPHQAVMSALEAARDANLSNIIFSTQTKK